MKTLTLSLCALLCAMSHLANAQAGCTYELACNYDPAATIHADVCDFESCAGCTYTEASNYDVNALLDNGTCQFSSPVSDCADLNYTGNVETGDMLVFLGMYGNDCALNNPTECDDETVSTDNCTSVYACNYNPDATMDDGSCFFNDCMGCTHVCSYNYDPCVKVDNGSCIFPLNGPCYNDQDCGADFNNDFKVDTSDLLFILGKMGEPCLGY